MRVGDLVYCPIDLSSGEMWPPDGAKSLGIIIKIENLNPAKFVKDNTIVLVSYPAWTGSNFFDSWQMRHLRPVE